MTDWCGEAEAASVAGDRDIAAYAVEVLAPYAGPDGRLRVRCSTMGPVDGYLALALGHAR